LRVLALVPRYVPTHNAGSEVMIARLNRVLIDAGHEVQVIATWHSSRDGYIHEGVRVHEVSQAEADERVVASSPDVILTHYDEVARAARLSARTGIPWVAVIHKDSADAAADLARGPHLSVFNTHHLAAHFADHAGASLIVHPPVFVAEHAVAPGEAVTLVNLSAEKGAGVFYALADRFPRWPFLGVLGAYGRQDIRTDRPNVIIHAHTSNMREVWRRTRIVLMPSVRETYGLVAVEAMASGIPVIAHPTPGLRESTGAGGLFADRDDLDAWAGILDRLTNLDRFAAASAYARFRSRELATEGAAEMAAFVAAVERLAAGRIAPSGRSQPGDLPRRP
jgi:glycosyltransferase involved in cell wall biosynthesis